ITELDPRLKLSVPALLNTVPESSTSEFEDVASATVPLLFAVIPLIVLAPFRRFSVAPGAIVNVEAAALTPLIVPAPQLAAVFRVRFVPVSTMMLVPPNTGLFSPVICGLAPVKVISPPLKTSCRIPEMVVVPLNKLPGPGWIRRLVPAPPALLKVPPALSTSSVPSPSVASPLALALVTVPVLLKRLVPVVPAITELDPRLKLSVPALLNTVPESSTSEFDEVASATVPLLFAVIPLIVLAPFRRFSVAPGAIVNVEAAALTPLIVPAPQLAAVFRVRFVPVSIVILVPPNTGAFRPVICGFAPVKVISPPLKTSCRIPEVVVVPLNKLPGPGWISRLVPAPPALLKVPPALSTRSVPSPSVASPLALALVTVPVLL